jgi:hypothetical protein
MDTFWHELLLEVLPMKEQQFLKERGVWFGRIGHRRTFTAQHTAQALCFGRLTVRDEGESLALRYL